MFMRVLLLLFLLASRVLPAYAFVSLTDNANAGYDTFLNISQTVATGDVLIVVVTYGSPTTVTEGVTDGTNTYTQLGSTINDATNNQSMAVFICGNPVAGTYTQTFTLATSCNYRGMASFRYSGLDGAGTMATVGAARTGVALTTDALTTGNLNPGSQPGILFSIALEDQTGASDPVAGTGFTDRGTIPSWNSTISLSRAEDKRLTSTSAVAGTFTPSASPNGFLVLAVFIPEPGAGGGGSTMSGKASLLGVGK